ncbi:hypothetical protein HanXRQr2_Chr04g0162611 [Helianthus annuus]|uniref:Uncharacterized protein n=1 Tax=Helianthus annuus TaxID=4232 RepID=A0A9K3J6V6_HELAN|nr:hypothetical protein HanXRQr2_Chr04g0162611 [Helianthus annuus]
MRLTRTISSKDSLVSISFQPRRILARSMYIPTSLIICPKGTSRTQRLHL